MQISVSKQQSDGKKIKIIQANIKKRNQSVKKNINSKARKPKILIFVLKIIFCIISGFEVHVMKKLFCNLLVYFSACDLNHNPLFVHCNTSTSAELETNRNGRNKNGYFIQPDMHGLTIDDMEVQKQHRGITIKASDRLKVRYFIKIKHQEIN